MGQRYPYPTRWGKQIVANIHIYGARAIFLPIYDNHDTESELREIKIGGSVPIFAHKNINDSMGNKYSYSTIWDKNIAAI